eukprot:COSAG01_NODE_2106_length_8416_cov_47.839485_12_plen_49_part_00
MWGLAGWLASCTHSVARATLVGVVGLLAVAQQRLHRADVALLRGVVQR